MEDESTERSAVVVGMKCAGEGGCRSVKRGGRRGVRSLDCGGIEETRGQYGVGAWNFKEEVKVGERAKIVRGMQRTWQAE